MLPTSSAAPIGFSMKSDAPAFIAWMAVGTSLFPVIMITGKARPSRRSLSSRSKPLIPGR